MEQLQTWKLVADARSQWLKQWTWLAVPLLALVIAQSILGRYESAADLSAAWGWLCWVLVPSATLLYGSLWLQKYPAKLLHPKSVSTLRMLILLHLLVGLVTLLLMPMVLDNWTPTVYLNRSLIWVSIPNIALTLGLYLTLWRKEARLRPNTAMLTQVAQAQEQTAGMQHLLQKQRCLQLIAANELPAAFEQMGHYFQQKSEEDYNHLILLKSRYVHVTDQYEKGVVESNVAQIEINRIIEALLNLTKRIQA